MNRLQTSIAVLYCAITWILYYDEILPYLANTAIDGLLLIAVIVVAVTVGKPLSYLNCQHLGSASSMFGTYAAVESLGQSLNHSNFSYALWVAATKSTCLMMKAIWGLSIALWLVYPLFRMCQKIFANNIAASCSHSQLSAQYSSGAELRPLHKSLTTAKLAELGLGSIHRRWCHDYSQIILVALKNLGEYCGTLMEYPIIPFQALLKKKKGVFSFAISISLSFIFTRLTWNRRGRLLVFCSSRPVMNNNRMG